ncbi:MAG: toxin co-regulated pilus biosynthesis Q family protein [Alphaproteobacteria bacterium]|nr:toxin co-regulated pilus biosynthesis Q family protein [Alphaproteobacteria bacterium]
MNKLTNKSQNRQFYKAIAVVSFLSIASLCQNAQATTTLTIPANKSVVANQIGFRVASPASDAAQRVVDQGPVVIQGHPQQQQPNAAPARVSQQRSGNPSLSMEPVVEGFGDKVPLTVAIQQILPQGYGYTLGDGVDAGQLVSWRGGRPWNAVMQDMLASSGLSYSANGRSVAINSTGAAPTIVTGSRAPVIQPVPQVAQQQTIIQPPMQPQQPAMMQQQPQMVMMQQPQMQPQMQTQMQPQMQPMQQVAQQPVMMQQPQPMMMDPQQQMMMQQQPVMMQQPVAMQSPAAQMQSSASPQPLQIENPLLFQSQTWEAHPGQTLRALLQEWCSRVGAELNWTAEFDYPIMASMNMTGTFEEAVRVLLTGFDAAKPTPRGRLHYNPAAGQSILIVEADGNHYGD